MLFSKLFKRIDQMSPDRCVQLSRGLIQYNQIRPPQCRQCNSSPLDIKHVKLVYSAIVSMYIESRQIHDLYYSKRLWVVLYFFAVCNRSLDYFAYSHPSIDMLCNFLENNLNSSMKFSSSFSPHIRHVFTTEFN